MHNGYIIGRVWKYVARYRLMLILSFILAIVSSVGMLWIPLLIGDAIDCAVGQGSVNFEMIARLLWRIGIITVVIGLSQWLMNISNNRIVYSVLRDVRTDAFNHIQSLPLSYLDSHPTGDIVSRVITDADQFSEGLLMGFTQLFTGVVTIVGTLVFMIRLQLWMALLVLVMTPLSLFVARFIANSTYKLFKKQSEIRGDQTAVIGEMVGHQKVVQAFSHEKASQAKFDEINDNLKKISLKATFYSSLVNPSTRFINSLVYAVVALVGAMSVLSNPVAFTVGNLTCFLSYANQYTKPFNEISGVVAELQNAIACAGRLLDLIEEKTQVPEDGDAVTLDSPDGQVELQDVSFAYVPEQHLIEHLNLEVRPGQRIAIVGPTGCGKTTLINLLMRFYDPVSGTIRVDGKDIRHLTRRSLRNNYGMVLQETWLQSGTVRDNIALGKPEATDEEIVAAAVAAHADGFIRRLPDGYMTEMGEEGGNLSAGQRQLLCIARLFLCLPPMLILDEATSSIDIRTEQQIQNAFAALMRGRTSFIVAHRLSTIQSADVILVMRDGNVVEQGNHKALLEQKGFYYHLYMSQFEH